MFIKYFKIKSSFFSQLFGEKRFVYSVKVFPLNIKSISPIQKYPHITESYACILKMFVFMDKERPIDALISLGISSTPKESKKVTLLSAHKATQWVPISEYSPRFMIYVPSFSLGRLSRE